MLSRIGTEPAREMLLKYAKINTGANEETPGFLNLCSLRPSCWAAFVGGMEREYGGWDEYVTKALEFSEEDLTKIKASLRG
jgi:hypothetical protein